MLTLYPVDVVVSGALKHGAMIFSLVIPAQLEECPWALFPDAYGSHGSAFYIGKELGILVALAVASGFSHTGVGHVSLTVHFCLTEIQPPQLWFVVSTNSTFPSIPQNEMNIPNLYTVLGGS